MTGLSAFGVTLAAALVVWLVFDRFGTPEMRAALDRLANKSKLFGQDRVAQIGESTAMRDGFGKLIMPLTLGVRLISTALVIALLVVLNLHSEDSAVSPIPPEYFWEGYMLASALVAWYMGFVWTYQLTLDGPRLIVPTWRFGSRAYDLRKLIRLEDDGAFMLRLYFQDGGKAEIFKHLRGRMEFKDALDLFAPETA